MEFDSTIDHVLNIQTDLLLDIYSWHLAIVEKMSIVEAKNNGTNLNDEMLIFQKLKEKHRNQLYQSLYAKFGPDFGKDILNQNEDRD